MMTGSARMARLDLVQQLDARAAGHADVGDEHLRLVGVERSQHVASAAEAAHRELLAGERLFEHEADRLIVVDDPDGFHGRPVIEELPNRLRAPNCERGRVKAAESGS